MQSYAELINQKDHDNGIGWFTREHPFQSWKSVEWTALEYDFDLNNPLEVLWARLITNNVVGGRNSLNHPLLTSETLNGLALNSQIICETGCYDLYRTDKCESCQSKELLIAYSERFIARRTKSYGFATRYGFEYQDLKQTARLGLLKALKTWEVDGGMDFLGWSKYSVNQEMRSMITNDGLLMRIPYQKRILQSKLPTIRQELKEELGYDPSYAEMSYYIRLHEYDKGCQTKLIPPEEIAFLENFHLSSLNEKVAWDESEEVEIIDLVPGKTKDPADVTANKDLLEKLLSPLSKIEEIVIRNYHKAELGSLNAEEVADMLPSSPYTGKKYNKNSISAIFDRATLRMKFEAKNLGFNSPAECLE